MADIHGIPDASMMVSEQAFTSEPLPDLGAAFQAAGTLSGAGLIYPMGPRQRDAETLMNSPQGFSAGGGTSGFDMTSGWSGGWPADVQPSSLFETPIQGSGDYPGTM